jgi:hypothetical protein
MPFRHPVLLKIHVAEQRSRPVVRPAYSASRPPDSARAKVAKAGRFFHSLLGCYPNNTLRPLPVGGTPKW